MRVPWPVMQTSIIRPNDVYQFFLFILCPSKALIALRLHHDLIIPSQTQHLILFLNSFDMLTLSNHSMSEALLMPETLWQPAHVILAHTEVHEVVLRSSGQHLHQMTQIWVSYSFITLRALSCQHYPNHATSQLPSLPSTGLTPLATLHLPFLQGHSSCSAINPFWLLSDGFSRLPVSSSPNLFSELSKSSNLIVPP